MERAFLHKSKTAGFGNIEARRTETFVSLRDARRSRRAQDFNRCRRIDEDLLIEPEPTQAVESLQQKELNRRNALKKYLEEKEAKKQAVKHKQRPPFVVGIPHHGASPVLRDLSNRSITDKKIVVKKEEVRPSGSRVTRATAKATMKAPLSSKVPNSKVIKKKTKSPVKVFPFVKNKSKFVFQHNAKALTHPLTPDVLKRSTQKNPKFDKCEVQPKKKILFKNNTGNVKPPTTRKRMVVKNALVEHAVSNQTSVGTETDQASIESITDQVPANNSVSEALILSGVDQVSVNSSVNDNVSINQSIDQETNNYVNNETLSASDQAPIDPRISTPISNLASVDNYDTNQEPMNTSGVEQTAINTSVAGRISANNSVDDGTDQALIETRIDTPATNSAPVGESVASQELINISGTEQTSVNASVSGGISAVGDKADGASSSVTPTDQAVPPPVHQDAQPDNPEAFKHRERVRTETAELLELAETWHQVTLQGDVPQDLVDEIDSLVGQTRLLTRDKFKQMLRVIDDFEHPQPNAPVVSVDDVEGFWDMIYLQVSPLKKRYTKLELLKQNNWEEPKSPPKRKRVKRIKRDTAAPKTGDSSKKTPRRSKRSTKHFAENTVLPSSIDQLNHYLEPGNSSKKTPMRSPRLTKYFSGDTLLNALPSALDQSNHYLGSEQTPRKSLRLASQPLTPLMSKLCSYCDSPDCKNTGCKTVKSASSKKAKPAQAKKFVLKPSTLIPPEPVNSEMTSTAQPRGRKSRRIQNNEQRDTEAAELTPQTRSRRVTFNNADGEKQSMKLPVTPYSKPYKRSSRTPKDVKSSAPTKG